MNALKILMIVLALAIFGCAGVERKCVEDAVNQNQAKSEELDRIHSEPRVTDSCKQMESEDKDYAYFVCDVADAIDDEDYAHLLDMHMRSLRMRIASCLR